MCSPVYPVVAEVNPNSSTEPGHSGVPGQGVEAEGGVDGQIGGEEESRHEGSEKSEKNCKNLKVVTTYCMMIMMSPCILPFPKLQWRKI